MDVGDRDWYFGGDNRWRSNDPYTGDLTYVDVTPVGVVSPYSDTSLEGVALAHLRELFAPGEQVVLFLLGKLANRLMPVKFSTLKTKDEFAALIKDDVVFVRALFDVLEACSKQDASDPKFNVLWSVLANSQHCDPDVVFDAVNAAFVS